MGARELLSTSEKIAFVQQSVREAGDDIRQRFPVLTRQNLIGGSIMAGSIAGILACAGLYYFNVMAWWLVIPLVAICQSFIHELEHDLIHLMYFKNNKFAYNLMMLLCWVTRPSTVNPWFRKKLHFHHHKVSGSESDLEERGITNGEKWGVRRLLMTGDNLASVWMRPLTTFEMVKKFAEAQKLSTKKETLHVMLRAFNSYAPIGLLHYAAWYTFLVVHFLGFAMPLFGAQLHMNLWQSQVMHVLDFLAVAWMIPSHLRTFCLHFVSSNIHYYGDIDSRNVIQQCQVINHWAFIPLHLFCFNFGATHHIHHFVVRDPFYIRQMIAKKAHVAMKEVGVRFNDFGTFKRANRFAQVHQSVEIPATALAKQLPV